jgi:hypothetical protein
VRKSKGTRLGRYPCPQLPVHAIWRNIRPRGVVSVRGVKISVRPSRTFFNQKKVCQNVVGVWHGSDSTAPPPCKGQTHAGVGLPEPRAEAARRRCMWPQIGRNAAGRKRHSVPTQQRGAAMPGYPRGKFRGHPPNKTSRPGKETQSAISSGGSDRLEENPLPFDFICPHFHPRPISTGTTGTSSARPRDRMLAPESRSPDTSGGQRN